MNMHHSHFRFQKRRIFEGKINKGKHLLRATPNGHYIELVGKKPT